MAKEKPTTPKPEPTPTEKFEEAAKKIFNLPKAEVDKIKKEVPLPQKKRRPGPQKPQ